jgi:hypothetical protein
MSTQYGLSFIRLRRRPRALPMDECGLCGQLIPMLLIDATADFATGG